MEACFQLNDIFVVSSFSLFPSCQDNFSFCCFQFPCSIFMLCWPPCVHSSIEVIFCIFFFAQRKDNKIVFLFYQESISEGNMGAVVSFVRLWGSFLFIFRKLVCSSLNDVRIVLCLTTDPLQFLNAVKCGGSLSPYHERRKTDPGEAAWQYWQAG